ncbi:hypothetical protein [Brevibacillus dissolubilis]|uniref:hypothetical protein n=1 Tax=Brevibacillus dissolubilis TaxID=1844116 RepID=UPI0011174CAF|nr:hypothetical protein [Brevibacillus dissolubilis]
MIQFFSHPFQDCITISVSGVLRPYVQTEQLWYQNKLFAVKANDEIRFAASIESFHTEISRYSKIEVDHVKANTIDEFIDCVDLHLGMGKYLLVSIDNYYSPYSQDYRTMHGLHWVILWKKEGRTYSIADYFYHHHIDFDVETLKESMEGARNLNQADYIGCFVMNQKSEWNPINLCNYKDAIEDNLTYMIGKSEVGSTIPDTNLVVIEQGLDVFRVMYQKIASIEDDLSSYDENSGSFKLDFERLSNHRYLFSEFLGSLDVSYPSKHETIELLTDISHDYRVCRNLAIKSAFDGSKSIKKMADRLEKIERNEQTLLKQYENILRELS